MKTATLLPLALALVVGQAVAGTEQIDQSRDVAGDATIRIDNVKGEVNVHAWDRDQVHVTGTLGSGARALRIDGDRNDLRIKVEGPERSGWFSWGNDAQMGPTLLNVQVPRGVDLEVNVVSAPVNVDGLHGGKVEVDSVSGRVRLDVDSPDVSVNTVSGNAELAGKAGSADIQTVSGDVLASQLGETAKLETVSGRMRVGGGPYRKVEASTVSGDLELDGGLADDGRIDIDSMSGDVRLRLATPLSAGIKASSFSGDLHSDFGDVREHEHGPGSELDTEVGGGHGRITIETFSGEIRIQKGG